MWRHATQKNLFGSAIRTIMQFRKPMCFLSLLSFKTVWGKHIMTIHLGVVISTSVRLFRSSLRSSWLWQGRLQKHTWHYKGMEINSPFHTPVAVPMMLFYSWSSLHSIHISRVLQHNPAILPWTSLHSTTVSNSSSLMESTGNRHFSPWKE